MQELLAQPSPEEFTAIYWGDCSWGHRMRMEPDTGNL